MKVLIHYPDGSKSRLSNVFLHDGGFLCRVREEAHGIARTNWTKRGGIFELEMQSGEVRHIVEPVLCPGKLTALNGDRLALQARIDACRRQKDFSPILADQEMNRLFYTLGDNGNGYKVEVV